MKLRSKLARLLSDSSGQDMLEYALIAALISTLMIAFIPPGVEGAVSTTFSKIVSALNLSAQAGS